jgi:3-deoxy-D-manno-octulosonic-acid transferase
VYKNISLIFPISEVDKNRFLHLFPYPEKMIVAGDTRFDQVYNKAQKVRATDEVAVFNDNSGLKLITGSIWPADEKHLMPALIGLYKKHAHLKLILVPHELHEAHISDIETILAKEGIESERYTQFEKTGGTTKRVAIINTIGMLARIYKQTQLAYVGGSFSTGVHNVMEPAVFGQPVVFGPEYHNSFEAMELIREGCGFSGSSTAELEKLLDRFISNESDRKETGDKAKNLIEQNIGATRIIINKLKETYGFIS